jgi:hypothetical protein
LPSDLINSTRECIILDVNVRPFNRIGPGKMTTSTVVRASDKGFKILILLNNFFLEIITVLEPQRFAIDVKIYTVNATHLNITWNWEGIDACENVLGAKV